MKLALLLLLIPDMVFGEEFKDPEAEPTPLNFEKAMAIENHSDNQLDLILELTRSTSMLATRERDSCIVCSYGPTLDFRPIHSFQCKGLKCCINSI